MALTQTRQAHDLLTADGVPLVRHRRRTLLALAERFLDLADLGFLETANLQRKFLERRRRDGERRQQLGVPIALDDLRRDRRGLEPEPLAHGLLDGRIEMRKRADGAGNLADTDDLAGPPNAFQVPAELGVPERQLQSERHDFGVDAVRAADHRRLPMLEGARLDRLGQGRHVPEDQVASLDHLQRLRRVDDVRGRQAEVKPARRGAGVFRDRCRERDDVVLSRLLDLFDAGDVEAALLAQGPCSVVRHDAGRRHRVGCRQLNLQPRLVLSLFAPDTAHFWVRVSGNHERDPGTGPPSLACCSTSFGEVSPQRLLAA